MTSLRIDTSEWIASSLIIGETGLGVLGSDIPSTGADGVSILYNDITLPADADKEIRALKLTDPSDGDLFIYEDGSLTFANAADGEYTFTYQLYVDGVSTGSPATVTLNVGEAAFGGSAISISTCTAALTTSIQLAATAASVSTCTAALTTGIALSASATSVSTCTADLSMGTLLAANATSVSTCTAALTTAIQLAATATSVSTASANLTIGAGTIIDPTQKINITVNVSHIPVSVTSNHPLNITLND